MLIAAGVILALLLFWILFLRRWLKRNGYAPKFFAWIEPFEIALYKKSETILWARIKQFGGAIYLILSIIGTVNVSIFVSFVPPEYQGFVNAAPGLALMLIGIIDEYQRRTTTKPIEVVEAPDNAPKEVLQAIARAETAKDAAVASVNLAKQEEKI